MIPEPISQSLERQAERLAMLQAMSAPVAAIPPGDLERERDLAIAEVQAETRAKRAGAADAS
jgi:hypothetical protein